MVSTYAPFNRDYDDVPRKELPGTVSVNFPRNRHLTAKNFWGEDEKPKKKLSKKIKLCVSKTFKSYLIKEK